MMFENSPSFFDASTKAKLISFACQSTGTPVYVFFFLRALLAQVISYSIGPPIRNAYLE